MQKMAAEAPNARLEMFCDGVFAIAITLLVLEIKVPPLESVHSATDLWRDIGLLWPSFFALVLSFILIFISWMGHHLLLKALDKTSNKFQAANGIFLFTVIIIPFPTAFMAEYLNTDFAQPAVVFYSLISLLHNLGWRLLIRSCIKPVSLAKTPAHAAVIQGLLKGNLFGTFTNVSFTIIAWWFPHIAITLSTLFWSYWLYLFLYKEKLEK